MPLTLATFGGLDWGVLLGYAAMLFTAGVALNRRKLRTTREYFLGERGMPVWAVAISVIATSLSAATFLGVPQMSYSGDLTYLGTNIGSLIGVLVVAGFFIPAFYRANVTSIYELLERRFGRRASRAASGAFMLGRVLANGSRLYMAAFPIALVLFGDRGETPAWQLGAGIAVITLAAVVCTLSGGISSVIWIEVVQTLVLLAAAGVAIGVLVARIPPGVSETARLLSHAGADGSSKLRLFNAGGGGFADAYSLPSILVCFTLFAVAAYGTDHDLAQRTLTCRSAVKGGQSAVLAILLGVPVVLLFLVIGLLLYVFYARPDVMGGAGPGYEPGDTRKVFLTFILREMPRGVTGLMIAGLCSVGVSSLASALNAMGATLLKDVYQPLNPGRAEAHYVRVGKIAVVGWGVVLALFACVCISWQRAAGTGLIDFALGVMTFAYAGLTAVFLTAIFTRRGNSASAIAALVVGALVVGSLQPSAWARWMPLVWAGTGEPPPAPAWPWHLAAGVLAAMAVCCIPRGRPAEGSA